MVFHYQFTARRSIPGTAFCFLELCDTYALKFYANMGFPDKSGVLPILVC